MINDGSSQPAPEKFEAAKYSSGKVVMMKNLHLIVLVNFYRGFISIFSVKDVYNGSNMYLNCSSSVPFMVYCRTKKTSFMFSCAVSFNNTR